MIIERYPRGVVTAIYERLRDHGRTIPDGLSYQGSWISADLGRCFLLMEGDDAAKLQEWSMEWADLVDIEIVPVTPSAQTQTMVAPYLKPPAS
ncbi:MAG: DUF3303 family protein [Thermomicrobiales bacterium]